MFFDSHCHLDRIDLSGFQNDLDVLLDQCHQQLVTEMICIGVTIESLDNMIQKVGDKHGIYLTAGVHPDYKDIHEPNVKELVELTRSAQFVAVGETGLDYFHTDGPQLQRNRFRVHIDAAIEVDKPIVIHTRNAKKDTIGILKEHHAEQVGGVMHCFTEDWDMAKQAIDMGFYISISGIVTFKQAKNVREMAAKIPNDRLLIETDSPWLAPVPYRGKTNFPGHVKLVAEKLAEIRNTDVETIASQTTANARKLFKL